MKTSLLRLTAVLFILSIAFSVSAQEPGRYPAKRLTHRMTPEEAQNRHLIGRDFVQTDPPPGTVTSLGEFERAKGVLIAYPFGIPMTMIREMARDAIVTTLVTGLSQENNVRNQYTNAGVNLDNCNFIYAQSDSYWTRDYGPWFIAYGTDQIGIVDFPYNRPRPNDDEVPKVVADALGIPWFGMNVIHTGGNYMSDSYGNASSTMIAYTENPGQTPAQVDQKMQAYLGINNYHVLEDPNNTYIDHIDCWGKYLATNKILIRSVPQSHPQYDEIEETAAYFASLTTPWNCPFEVYRVNTPQNQPYTNSFIFNDKVFVPIMGSQHDEPALEVYRQAMPGYKVFGIVGLPGEPWESTDALHCRTHEMADPEMLRIRHIPLLGNQSSGNSYSFAANITAYSGSEVIADSALFYYRVNPNPYTPYEAVTMTNTMGTNWSVTIAAPEHGSTVQYYIHAADATGRSENHPFIGKPDPHEFYVGEQLFAQAETNLQQMEFTAMQALSDNQSLNLSNTGELGLNYYISLSTEAYDTISKTLTNSPALTAWDYNTYTENGWTDVAISQTGQVGKLIVSYNWDTDNYPTEGSLWIESPAGTQVMIASGQADGNYSLTNSSFSGEPIQGNWKVWLEDTYGDGGHQAKNMIIKFVRATETGNWLSVDNTEGSVAPGNNQEIVVTCDATGMALGTYAGMINILSNDPDQPEIEIPVTFTVTVNTGMDVISTVADEIRVFPNPASELLNIEITTQLPGLVSLILTDLSGKELLNQGNILINSGSNTITIPLYGLQKGNYLLRVSRATYNKTLKISRQ
jgi:agmatine deiminase